MYSYYITFATNTNSENNYCVYIENTSIKYMFVYSGPTSFNCTIYIQYKVTS